MNKIFQFFSVIAVVLIVVVVIPSDSKSNVVISYNYPISVSQAQNCIKYEINNSRNALSLIDASKSTLGTYGDSATVYVNSTWWTGIASDTNGNTFYVDSYGHLYENFSKQTTLRYLGTPYSTYPWYGPIVGVAVSSNTISQGGALVQELSEWGAVFELNVTNGNTISKGWYEWILPHSGLPNTLFCAINEVISINSKQEIFMYFATNGTIFYYYPANGPENNNFYHLTYSKSPAPFVSATVYSYSPGASGNIHFMPFGLLYNGSVYIFNGNAWNYFGTASAGARAISISPSSTASGNPDYFYLMVILLKNSTYAYMSNQLIHSSTSATFSQISIPTSQGTNEADFYSWGYGWYILQTNGTIAHSSSQTNPTTWNYFSLLPSYYNTQGRYYYIYPKLLNITDSCTNSFTVFANISSGGSSGIYNMQYFNLTFYNSTKQNRTQFIFSNVILSYPMKIINISNSNKIFINISFFENMAYNAIFYFFVYTYPQGNNNILISYQLKIIMIDHFAFIPI
jgi:hypothetical protein